MSDIKDFVIEEGVLKAYNGGDENIVIPSEIAIISDSAFAFNKKLVSVEIPNGVTIIGSSAINSERDLRKTQQKTPNNIENSLQMIA